MFIDNVIRLIFLLIIVVIIILFTSRFFSAKNDDTIDDISSDNIEVEYVDDFPTSVVKVPGHEFLFYNIDTLDVYEMFIKDDYEFLDIFIVNNHKCKYLSGKIVEMLDDKIIAFVHPATLPK